MNHKVTKIRWFTSFKVALVIGLTVRMYRVSQHNDCNIIIYLFLLRTQFPPNKWKLNIGFDWITKFYYCFVFCTIIFFHTVSGVLHWFQCRNENQIHRNNDPSSFQRRIFSFYRHFYNWIDTHTNKKLGTNDVIDFWHFSCFPIFFPHSELLLLSNGKKFNILFIGGGEKKNVLFISQLSS